MNELIDQDGRNIKESKINSGCCYFLENVPGHMTDLHLIRSSQSGIVPPQYVSWRTYVISFVPFSVFLRDVGFSWLKFKE